MLEVYVGIGGQAPHGLNDEAIAALKPKTTAQNQPGCVRSDSVGILVERPGDAREAIYSPPSFAHNAAAVGN